MYQYILLDYRSIYTSKLFICLNKILPGQKFINSYPKKLSSVDNINLLTLDNILMGKDESSFEIMSWAFLTLRVSFSCQERNAYESSVISRRNGLTDTWTMSSAQDMYNSDEEQPFRSTTFCIIDR